MSIQLIEEVAPCQTDAETVLLYCPYYFVLSVLKGAGNKLNSMKMRGGCF